MVPVLIGKASEIFVLYWSYASSCRIDMQDSSRKFYDAIRLSFLLVDPILLLIRSESSNSLRAGALAFIAHTFVLSP